jgi:antitoxin PrlF
MTTNQSLYSESTLTDRYQTTIPEPIRKLLGLNKRDKIAYTIQSDNQVVISRVDHNENDPILTEFLNFLAEDIKKNPQNLKIISSDLVNNIRSLVSDIDLDLNELLSDEDE